MAMAAVPHVMSNGTYFVSAGAGFMDELYLADRTGRITRRVGRKGEGPGEYEQPWLVAEAPGVYVVFDFALRRTTHLSKESLTVAATWLLPARPATSPAPFADGRYVLNGVLQGSGRQDRPVHIVAPDGRVLRSIGTRETGDRIQRLVAIGGDSTVWVARLDEYRIERWDTGGTLAAVYERRTSWFPAPGAERRSANVTSDGRPHLLHLYEDSIGRLWVLSGVAKRRPQDQGSIGPFWDKSESRLIVEVIDTRAHRLLWSETVPGYYGVPAAGGFFEFSPRLSANNGVLLDIWAYELHERQPHEHPPSRRSR